MLSSIHIFLYIDGSNSQSDNGGTGTVQMQAVPVLLCSYLDFPGQSQSVPLEGAVPLRKSSPTA